MFKRFIFFIIPICLSVLFLSGLLGEISGHVSSSLEIGVLPEVNGTIDVQSTFTESIPLYLTATLLLEELGGGELVELVPAQNGWLFDNFFILQEGITYTLWLNNRYQPGGDRVSVEQHLQSTDGLIWRNRINTDLVDNTPDYRYSKGLRQVIKNGNLYEGWESYYYNTVQGMWVPSIRYIYSLDGIIWNVGNDPVLISGRGQTVIKEDGVYRMWVRPAGDTGYTGPRMLRYRVSTEPGSGWGHWQTGGVAVNLDGEEVRLQSRVRKLDDGTYQLFYRPYEAKNPNVINLATSNNGITFTLAISGLVDYSSVLPDFYALHDFQVVDMGGEDWFYFTYRNTADQGRVAVARPEMNSVYLPIVAYNVCSETSSPTDVILSLDTSGSMAQPSGDGVQTKLEVSKEAASIFINLLNFTNDQAGIVSFNDEATVDHHLSNNASSLQNALQALVADGTTRMDLALATSRYELTSPYHDPNSAAVLILLTDGRPSISEDIVLAEVDVTKGAGITIFTIGLGEDVNTNLLQGIASSPTHYYYAPSAAELTAIYEQIANIVHCP